jgi:hypothetical protein
MAMLAPVVDRLSEGTLAWTGQLARNLDTVPVLVPIDTVDRLE